MGDYISSDLAGWANGCVDERRYYLVGVHGPPIIWLGEGHFLRGEYSMVKGTDTINNGNWIGLSIGGMIKRYFPHIWGIDVQLVFANTHLSVPWNIKRSMERIRRRRKTGLWMASISELTSNHGMLYGILWKIRMTLFRLLGLSIFRSAASQRLGNTGSNIMMMMRISGITLIPVPRCRNKRITRVELDVGLGKHGFSQSKQITSSQRSACMETWGITRYRFVINESNIFD